MNYDVQNSFVFQDCGDGGNAGFSRYDPVEPDDLAIEVVSSFSDASLFCGFV